MLALTVAYSGRDAPFGTVGRAGAQAALRHEVHRDTGLVFCALVKRVGCSRRRGPCLIMIEMNVVLRNVSQLIRREIELRRDDVSAHGARIGGIAIDRPRPLVVAYGEYPAGDIGFGVIERGQDDRRAELSFVDQICRQLVIAIESDGQARER